MNPKHLQERRAFNEQLRARLRLVAAERGVSDMKWLGRLRHVDLISFVQTHGLSWDWVLCGDLPRPALKRWTPHVIQGGLQ